MKKSLIIFSFFISVLLIQGYAIADLDIVLPEIIKTKIFLSTGDNFVCYLEVMRGVSKLNDDQLLKQIKNTDVPFYGLDGNGNFPYFKKVEKIKYPFVFYATTENDSSTISVKKITKIESMGHVSDTWISAGFSEALISLLNEKPRYILNGVATSYPCEDGHGDDGGFGRTFLVYNPEFNKAKAQKLCNEYEEDVWVKHFDKKCNFVPFEKFKDWNEFILYEANHYYKLGIIVLNVSDFPGNRVVVDIGHMAPN